MGRPLGINPAHCSFCKGGDGRECPTCGLLLNKQQRMWCNKGGCSVEFMKNHRWTEARAAALRRDNYQCVRCSSHQDLEVNHIVPLAHSRPGHPDPYSPSCHHHLDKIETLCHSCHLEATAKQRADGYFKNTRRNR